jgi:hypothetical protein
MARRHPGNRQMLPVARLKTHQRKERTAQTRPALFAVV